MALAHREPDRVPFDFWAVPEVWAQAARPALDAETTRTVLRLLGIDCRMVTTRYVGAKARAAARRHLHRRLGHPPPQRDQRVRHLRRVRQPPPGRGRDRGRCAGLGLGQPRRLGRVGRAGAVRAAERRTCATTCATRWAASLNGRGRCAALSAFCSTWWKSRRWPAPSWIASPTSISRTRCASSRPRAACWTWSTPTTTWASRTGCSCRRACGASTSCPATSG